MTITSVSLPKKLSESLQNLISSGYYKNKSECIREALRNLFMRYQPDIFEQNTPQVAAITALWDYHQTDIGKSLSKVREIYDGLLLGNFHMNVTNAYCLDVYIASGQSKEIFKLIKSIREIKNLDGVDFVILSSIPQHTSH